MARVVITNRPNQVIVRSPGPAGPAGGGSGGGVTEVTGTAPISVATGTTTPVVSLDADGITTGKIADEAVTNGKIADLTIQTVVSRSDHGRFVWTRRRNRLNLDPGNTIEQPQRPSQRGHGEDKPWFDDRHDGGGYRRPRWQRETSGGRRFATHEPTRRRIDRLETRSNSNHGSSIRGPIFACFPDKHDVYIRNPRVLACRRFRGSGNRRINRGRKRSSKINFLRPLRSNQLLGASPIRAIRRRRRTRISV